MFMNQCPDCKRDEMLREPGLRALINGQLNQLHMDCPYCGEVWVFTYDRGKFKVRNRDNLDID